MKVLYSKSGGFFLILFFLKIHFTLCQIYDNFVQDTLEEGNYDLLDITDYHNLGLIVSSSKAIYTSFPTTKKVDTNANLTKVSSLITINNNYLLAACLQDSFLGKINLSTGNFVSLLSYSDVDEDVGIIPRTICSLSNIDNIVFIGTSKFKEVGDETKKWYIISKITIKNKDLIDEGPSIDASVDIKYFSSIRYEGENEVIEKMETPSLRQVSCEPLYILDNPSEYRLVCLEESVTILYIYDTEITNYNVFVSIINKDLSDLEEGPRVFNVDNGIRGLGFRIFRENNTYARYVTGESFVEIYLTSNENGATVNGDCIHKLNADIDLISYNNKFIFSGVKTSLMKKNDIFCFQINQTYYTNYFKLYNYEENIIIKIMGYYNEDQNKILFLYQTDNNIKYFIIDYKVEIYSLTSFNHQLNLFSYQENVQYDLNTLVTTPPLTDLGYLDVEYIKYKISNSENLFEYFGTDFYETLMSNNILIPEPSLNDWKTYYLSFMDHIENKYTRIYHIENLYIKVQTCKSDCSACWTDYYTCTNCDDPGYAVLSDRDLECFPNTYLVDGYIYDSTSNKYLKCYDSCEFCTEVSTSSTEQKCSSCLSGYLFSYIYPGNCYPYKDLEISSEKDVAPDENKFIASTCSKYKISTTGECINECPSISSYFTYEYNEVSSRYEQVPFNPPKYLFNNICYEQCPENSAPNENDECVCEFYYYKDISGNTICLSEEQNCPSDYSYLNHDTKECFDSLDKCDHFFGDICYNNCPSDKILLSSQETNIKNYIKEKLSLDDNLLNKICICDTTNGVWSNINHENENFQQCLTSCPEGYIPEDITKQCIIQNSQFSTVTPNDGIDLTPDIDHSSEGDYHSDINDNSVSDNPLSDGINNANQNNNENINNNPNVPNENNNICKAKYENNCYSECPSGTCLTQEDPELKTCVRIGSNTQIFNGICFENFMEITRNIKSLADRGEIISSDSGVIIHGYSTKPNEGNCEDKNTNYSLVYLGEDCEYQIKSHYNLSNDTELYILGIDSPNKDAKSPINVYNYGVYLKDGTYLDHNEICKESKIIISSPITAPDLIKFEDALYFSDMGYDIYDENNKFYNDQCSSASINGNDIILSDRKKDFFPSDVSLCNDSCTYNQIDYNSKRFSCECDLSYNFSQKNILNEKNKGETEDDSSYIEYFLSLINYKIAKCYKLFLDYKSYYYNVGFYISVGTLIFCIIQIFIFTKCGIRSMDITILENVPNEMKLREKIKEQMDKRIKLKKLEKKSIKKNPPKKNNHFGDNIKKLRKEVQIEHKNNLKDKNKLELKDKTQRITKSRKNSKNINIQIENKLQLIDSGDKLNFYKNRNTIKVYQKIIDNDISIESSNHNELSNENLDVKEINVLPYTQAIREDKRNCYQMFLSVIAHEIKIINIFYYKNPYEHLSIILSQYMFELCLDLTLNCILYTEDVISEKYNNNGSIKFFTTLSLSFISNIISSIIAYFLSKLSQYSEFFEFILKDIMDKSKYYLNILRFKKLLCIKLTSFFFVQTLIILGMCYYLMIFCTVYHNTQGSIMINYLTGIAESMAISFGLSLITAIMRAVSISCKFKSLYYTSKYFFENF